MKSVVTLITSVVEMGLFARLAAATPAVALAPVNLDTSDTGRFHNREHKHAVPHLHCEDVAADARL